MKLLRCLLMLATLLAIANSDASDISPYQLPPSKIYIGPCQREILLLYPGTIEKERLQHRHEYFWMEYEIKANNGIDWLVICDLSNGKIIHEQMLIENNF